MQDVVKLLVDHVRSPSSLISLQDCGWVVLSPLAFLLVVANTFKEANMPHYDPRPLQIRIARLEDKLNKDDSRKRPGLFGDPSKVISIAAFIISIVTTVYSWRKDHLETQLANRKQLNETIQQQIDTGLKAYEFSTKNKSDPTVAALSGWFNAQADLM